ncbi:hypothetical protein R3P38DRAFT_2759227 [Favolaschia claudopus]|uniref:Uncharacterized protein n=1 Tax=Favolaschia claudopus TaxID=2862362 RepID=A0AAW0E6L7_9AGAR
MPAAGFRREEACPCKMSAGGSVDCRKPQQLHLSAHWAAESVGRTFSPQGTCAGGFRRPLLSLIRRMFQAAETVRGKITPPLCASQWAGDTNRRAPARVDSAARCGLSFSGNFQPQRVLAGRSCRPIVLYNGRDVLAARLVCRWILPPLAVSHSAGASGRRDCARADRAAQGELLLGRRFGLQGVYTGGFRRSLWFTFGGCFWPQRFHLWAS